MRTVQTWIDKVHDRDNNEQCIYSICFSPDGSQLIVAAGNRVLVYDPSDGSLLQPLKGHKDIVYCVCYAKDGKRFASGAADRNVIIWTSTLEGILKYSHNDAIQCMAYNPVTHQLASCAVSDFGLWSPEQKNVQKHKITSRINSCAWTSDGAFLALGLSSGIVSIRSKNGDEKQRIERPGGSQTPIWGLCWVSNVDEQYDNLVVADWGQALSFYSIHGKQVHKERHLGFNATQVSLYEYMGGEYLLVCGSGKQCWIMSKEGIKLGQVAELEGWVWCCSGKSESTYIAVGCQDGTVVQNQIIFNTVHGLYKERYAYREHMTDVVIQHLLDDQKARIKCRDLVKKIAVYKNRLAVQLSERVVIYEMYTNEDTMHYRVKERLSQKLECNLLVICSHHLVLCLEKKLESYSFQGLKEREWHLDSLIRYIKVIGGPPGREGLLLGLKTGEILKIYLDNPFPLSILKIPSAVRCLDLSADKMKLAVVDESHVCLVYDVNTKELLYQEPNANSVSWNLQCESMLCFSGQNLLNIKASDFPCHQQKFSGFVVGFCGAKIFCLQTYHMSTLEVPLSAPMYQYLEKKMFKDAYTVACLGVPTSDWKQLAQEALQGLEFAIAKKAFTRTQDLKYLELITSIEFQQEKGIKDPSLLLADMLAWEGKFHEAARLYKKAGHDHKALRMYTDMRMFDLAQEYASNDASEQRMDLLKLKADWAQNMNEPRAAAEMYLSAGETAKAIEIIAAQGWGTMLAEVARKLEKSDKDGLLIIAKHLQKLNMTVAAADVLRKANELPSLAKLYVEQQNWEEALLLGEQHSELLSDVYLPYAHWLAENDRFTDAQKAFFKAGKPEVAYRVLSQLTLNAVKESRFEDAGYYYWVLSIQSLQLAATDSQMLVRFKDQQKKSAVYYAYHAIHRFTNEPFTSYMPDALFNMARFLMHELMHQTLTGVSKFAVLYALMKQAKALGAFKLTRQVLNQMQSLRIPTQFQESVEIASLHIRGKPFQDAEELLPLCYRCSTTNPLYNPKGNACILCKQPFFHSYVSFEILPLVEFQTEDGVSNEEALALVRSTANEEHKTKDIMQFNETNEDPFAANLPLEGEEYKPLIINRTSLRTLQPNEVLICKWPSPLKYQYFRNLLPDVPLRHCNHCNKVFHADDFELQVLQKGHCPFCRNSFPLQE